MVAVLGVATLVSAGLSMAAGAVAIGWVGEVLGYGGASLVTFAVFLTVFMVLTAEPVAWRDAVFGAGVATVFWQALQGVGTWFVARQLRGAGDTYGFFAVVIALLSWMYMAAQLVLFAAEINVVRKYRLWPRSMTQPPLTPSDRETFERLARLETRRPEYEVSVRFKPSADGDPLAHDAGPRSPQLGDGAPWRRARRSHRNP